MLEDRCAVRAAPVAARGPARPGDLDMNRRDALGLAVGLATTAALTNTADAAGAAALAPILVIAATARSAPEILAQGLAEGRKVTALARNPDRIEVAPHPNLKVVRGDVYDLASLAAAMTGAEAVISLVGPRVVDHSKEVGFVDIYSVGTATIISAMRRRGNRRLIAVSSGGPEQIPPEKPTSGDPIDTWVWNARNLYGDMQRMEKIIAVSDLETVILRARNFGAGPRRDNLKLKVHDHYTDFDQYRDRAKRTPGERSRVTYADFAALCLGLAQGERFLGKAVGVYSDVPT
jgi:putative NADH-flavin reductase